MDMRLEDAKISRVEEGERKWNEKFEVAPPERVTAAMQKLPVGTVVPAWVTNANLDAL